jgi:hypothetical protein
VTRAQDYSWDAINRVVADHYIALIEERRAARGCRPAESA